jgi:DNA-binding XRE family transcriptional regulator
MDLREVFATNLRRLRHTKGLSQDDLAYEAEASRSYLSQIEKGAFFVSLKIAVMRSAIRSTPPGRAAVATFKPVSARSRCQESVNVLRAKTHLWIAKGRVFH